MSNELQQARARLTERRTQTASLIAAADVHIQRLADSIDQSVEVERLHTESERVNAWTRQLREIDEALKRIESGEYGRCVDCDRGIAPRRLEAKPEASRCIRCQDLHDLSASDECGGLLEGVA